MNVELSINLDNLKNLVKPEKIILPKTNYRISQIELILIIRDCMKDLIQKSLFTDINEVTEKVDLDVLLFMAKNKICTKLKQQYNWIPKIQFDPEQFIQRCNNIARMENIYDSKLEAIDSIFSQKFDRLINKKFEAVKSSLNNDKRITKSENEYIPNNLPSTIQIKILYIENYTSVFIIDEINRNIPYHTFIICLSPIQPDIFISNCQINKTAPVLKGSFGKNAYIMEFELINKALVGRFPTNIFLDETTINLECYVYSSHIEQLYFQFVNNHKTDGTVYNTIPVTFIKIHSIPIELENGLAGPQTDELNKRVMQDIIENTHVITPFCTNFEVEALAGWTLLRMIDLNEYVDDATLASSKVSEHITKQSFKDVTIPEAIRKLNYIQKRNRPQFPIRFNEFKECINQIKVLVDGANNKNDGLFLENSKALGSLFDPHRGYIPLSLKSALYLGLNTYNRTIVENYHTKIQIAECSDSKMANIFMRNRPGDKYIVILSFVLKYNTQKNLYDTKIEKFEANEERLAESRYWHYIDEITPAKNFLASRVELTEYYLNNFPQFTSNNDYCCEIGPGVYIYLESWPTELKSNTTINTMQAKYQISIMLNDFILYSLSSVDLAVIKFIFDDWLKATPYNNRTKVLTLTKKIKL